MAKIEVASRISLFTLHSSLFFPGGDMRIQILTTAFLLTAVATFADSTIEQKTQLHLGGAFGGVINSLGGKATHEGLTSTTAIKGNRKLNRTGDRGELIDLDAEKVYTIDFANRTYTVTTFDELRRRWEESQTRAEKHSERAKKDDQPQGPEWEIDFDMRSGKKKEAINGWDTHEEIATVTVHEKGKKLEESGGYVLTSDMWMGPRLEAMRELGEFERKYMQKVYGSAMDTMIFRMAPAMATQPAFTKAMKTMSEHRGKFEGSAIRTTMTFQLVPGPATADQPGSDAGASSPAGAIFGGLMRKAKERQAAKNGQSGEQSSLLDSLTEVLRATNTASSSDVAIPEGFRLK
jgi:hypothetical protein